MSNFNQIIDEVTFKAACHNKTTAQRVIYDTFATPIYNLVYKITFNKVDSLDISHDVFIKVFTKINQNKSPELLGFWIRKITINTTFTYLKNNAQLVTNINFKDKTIDDGVNETMSSLDFVLNKLPTIARSVLWMYEVEGMSHQEIADSYKKSISFSKTQLSRAKNLAQSFLTSESGGYKAIK